MPFFLVRVANFMDTESLHSVQWPWFNLSLNDN